MSSLVSVCIPVYNGEPYIRQTIEMVLEQDYDNMEIIVSDNASTDRTMEEIRKVSDERICVYHNETNLGMGGNWNALLHRANGDYLIIVCADDFLMPGAIRKKAAVLDADESVDIVFSSSYVMNEKGKKLMRRRPFRGNQKLIGSETIEEFFTTRNFMAEPTNNMLRRDAALRAGDFDNDLWYTVDWDFWIRMLKGGDAYYLDEPLSGFRVSGASTTGSNLKGREKILGDEEKFLSKYKDGDIIPVTQDMLERRSKNIRSRLTKKIIFMKMLGIYSRIFR